jgi:hypothetical protein
LALAAGLIGGSLTNNAIAGREAFAGEGFIRNAGASGLAKLGLTQIESTALIPQAAANVVKIGLAGGGYQGMNIAMGDRKPDGTAYTLQEGLRSSLYAGVGTGFGLGLGTTLGSRILGQASIGQNLWANSVALVFAPSVSLDYVNMSHGK